MKIAKDLILKQLKNWPILLTEENTSFQITQRIQFMNNQKLRTIRN